MDGGACGSHHLACRQALSTREALALVWRLVLPKDLSLEAQSPLVPGFRAVGCFFASARTLGWVEYVACLGLETSESSADVEVVFGAAFVLPYFV